MSDTALNRYIQYGTEAVRLAFTPNPATGSQILYLFYQSNTDTEPAGLYLWDGTDWVLVNPIAPTPETFNDRYRQFANWVGTSSPPSTAGGISAWTIGGGAFDYSDVNSYYRGVNQPSAGSDGIFRTSAFNWTEAQLNPELFGVVKVGQDGGSLLNRRIFFGLFSATPLFTADTINAVYAAVRFIPGVDTNWTAVVCNGVAGSTSTIDTGVPATAVGNIQYRIRIWTEDDGVTWSFSINDSTPVTLNTNVPAVSTQLGIVFVSRCLSAGNQYIGISRVNLGMD